MTALRERARPKGQDGVDTAYRRHSGNVRAFFLRRTGDRERAEDLTQEVFLHAASALAASSPDGPTLPLLYTVARRRFIDDLRARRRYPTESLDPSLHPSGGPAPEYGGMVRDAIAAGIAALPPKQRQVVVLKLLQGHSFRDIGAAVGSSEDAVKMQFSRALKTLRDHLRDAGVVEP
jgi:RNA polymerase sigma-70 factor (ECF subfamily)